MTGDGFDADVIVIGAGPCGLALAGLLGTYGVDTIVVERETQPLDYPRAVGIDDEALRCLQTFGAAHPVLADAIQNTPIRYYTSWGRCFAHVKPSEQPFGWPRRNLFLQPLMEATLRHVLAGRPHLDVRFGSEVLGIVPDAEGVTATVRDAAGATSTIRSRYLVGADGGRSSVRKWIGVELEGETHPVKWLVVDVADDQYDAPYSAVFCDKDQPVLMIPLPYGHRRWEFRVPPEVDDDAMTEPQHVTSLLRTRYGPTPLPRVVRARVYLHHSRTASRFSVERVFLAGDAAHLQPPFFGQGMNSGLRDATNLAWKLAAVVREQLPPALLDSYDAERRPHSATMVQFATRIGRMYQPRSDLTERFRDLVFRAVQRFPGGRDYILQMKYKPMPHFTKGAVVHSDTDGTGGVGRMFAQPDVETGDGARCKLDDAIGPWFALIGIGVDPRDTLSAATIAWWRTLGTRFVRVDGSRTTRRSDVAAPASRHPDDPAGNSADISADDLLVLEDVDGAFRDRLLARPSNSIIVLRPDRYVAAMTDAADAEAMSLALRAVFGG